MVINEADFDELMKTEKLLGASSITEAVRRSSRLTNKLLGAQEKGAQIIVRDKSGEQQVIIIT